MSNDCRIITTAHKAGRELDKSGRASLAASIALTTVAAVLLALTLTGGFTV